MRQRLSIVSVVVTTVLLCVMMSLAFGLGLYFGNRQAFGSRFRREANDVKKVLQEVGFDDKLRVIMGSYGEPIIVGQLESQHERDVLYAAFKKSWPNAMFDGLSLENNN